MTRYTNSMTADGPTPGIVERVGSSVLGLLRRLAQTRGFRVLTRVKFLTRISASMRGSLVAERAQFVRNELRLKDSTRTYHLASTGVAVRFRHHTPDVTILDEVFLQGLYEFPPEVSRLLNSLGRDPVVVDLGANIGLFGVYMLGRYPGVRMTAFEPDRYNAQVLRECIAANRADQSWELVQACASTQDGTLRFRTGDFATSQVVSDDTSDAGVETVPAKDVFPHLATADLLKMDMEGGEWDVMADPRFATSPIKAVVLEYHGDTCSEPDCTIAATRLVEQAGFETSSIFYDSELDVGMLWGWRPEAAG